MTERRQKKKNNKKRARRKTISYNKLLKFYSNRKDLTDVSHRIKKKTVFGTAVPKYSTRTCTANISRDKGEAGRTSTHID